MTVIQQCQYSTACLALKFQYKESPFAWTRLARISQVFSLSTRFWACVKAQSRLVCLSAPCFTFKKSKRLRAGYWCKYRRIIFPHQKKNKHQKITKLATSALKMTMGTIDTFRNQAFDCFLSLSSSSTNVWQVFHDDLVG